MSTLVTMAWLAVLAGGLLMLGIVGTLAWLQHKREHPPVPPAERAELARHAAILADSAARAAERAAAARRLAEQAADEAAAAWQEHERVQRAYEEASRAGQDAARQQAAGEDDPSGPREVGRAALAAYRRGELSQEQMLRVWRWSTGWDPEQERREHRLAELRAAQRDAYLRYRAASAAERVAASQADIADVAARALADEAAAAAEAVPDHVAR